MRQILINMNKKFLVQTALFIFTLLLIFVFYMNFFKQTKIDDKKIFSATEPSENQKKNQINDLQYFSKDENGNSYLLVAKSGYADKNNSDIIYLTNVNAKIYFDNKNQILVTSEKAVYNNSSYDTEFIDNVVINYGDHKLTTNKMNALISRNVAILSGNVIYRSSFTNLYADKIEYDLIERKSKISMFDKNKKVKVTHINNNGIN